MNLDDDQLDRGNVVPESGFLARKLQQQHARGNHENPETEEDYLHVQTNCPDCRKEHIKGLQEDHEDGFHDFDEHPDCATCKSAPKASVSRYDENVKLSEKLILGLNATVYHDQHRGDPHPACVLCRLGQR